MLRPSHCSRCVGTRSRRKISRPLILSCRRQAPCLFRSSMGMVTYYVALAFTKPEDDGDIVACDPKEARSPEQAIRIADSLAKSDGHCGAIAFSRTGDPALGDFENAVILKTVGEVDAGLLSA